MYRSDIPLQIESYLPETLFLRDKHRLSARVCREEIAVIDPADGYRLLVCRGAAQRKESLFRAYGIDRGEQKFLQNALQTEQRILLHSKAGELLVFADWLTPAGLLLAVLLPEPRGALIQALALIGQRDFAISPFPAETSQAVIHPLDEVLDHLDEIFYYLKGILSPSADIGLLTRAALIARLVGCQADCTSLPVEFPALLPCDTARLTAFLFCGLLALRNQSHPVVAEGTGTHAPARIFRCRLLFSDSLEMPRANREKHQTNKVTALEKDFSFLCHSAFQDFEITAEDGALTLQANLAPAMSPTLLHALGSTARLCLILG